MSQLETEQFHFLPIFNALDVDHISDFIEAQGIHFVHYRCMPAPIGLIDKWAVRRPDGSSADAKNGMIYTRAGCFKGLFVGNSKNVKMSEGILDAGVASLTPGLRYEDHPEEEIYLTPMDRLFLKEEKILVVKHEHVQFNPTGIDRPKYPAEKIQDIVDSNGIRYTTNDYTLVDGCIKWGDKNPGLQNDGQGIIYSIRYLYRPYWYVDRLVHDIRVSQAEDPYTFERGVVSLPKLAIIKREYIFENEASDSGTRRHQDAPEDGSLPPR